MEPLESCHFTTLARMGIVINQEDATQYMSGMSITNTRQSPSLDSVPIPQFGSRDIPLTVQR